MKIRYGLLSVLFLLVLSTTVNAGGQGFALPTDKNDGDEVSSDEFESNTNSLFDHMEPQYIDDEESNAAAQEAKVDPDAALPTTLKGSIQGRRWAINQNNHASTWKDYEEVSVITTNATASADSTNYIMSCTNDCTVTLLASATDMFLDKPYFFKNKATTTVTIDANGSETIDGTTTITLDGYNDFVRILCDGSNWHISAKNYSGVSDHYSNLYVYSVFGDDIFYITADSLTVKNSAGHRILLNSVSHDANLSSNGIYGLDIGEQADSTEYHAFIIYNSSTATTGSLISSSETAPSFPTGYDYWRKVSYGRTDDSGGGDADLISFSQQNDTYLYNETDIIVSGDLSTKFFTTTAVSTGGWDTANANQFIPSCTASTTQIYINYDQAAAAGSATRLKIKASSGTSDGSVFTAAAASEKSCGFFWISVYNAGGTVYVKAVDAVNSNLALAVAGFKLRL
jgi:hypothetical protein